MTTEEITKMRDEHKRLSEKVLTAPEVMIFISTYGGSYEGAKLGDELLKKLNSQ